MPWRLSELAHVQLLNAQWMPLVWLYVGRILYGGRGRRDVMWLSIVLSLQLLSSFYLAYQVLLSSAVLILVLWAQTPVQRAAAVSLARACAVPLALLMLVAVPYIRWSTGPGFHALRAFPASISPAEALSLIWPQLVAGLTIGRPLPTSYEIPLAVFVMALVAFLPSRRSADAERNRRCRAFTWALGTVCVASFILMLGRELHVGAFALKLPAHWASLIVPGFAYLRGSARWAIPIGVAFPVLAGFGVARLERHIGRRKEGGLRLGSVRAVLIAAFVVSLPTGTIPARDGWRGVRQRNAGYRALAALPPGPVIEIPWPLQPMHDMDVASQYLLASTLHWRPLANGTSGYSPASYPLLRQIAAGLPALSALRGVQDLADVRWIVVHLDALDAERRAAWADADRSGTLRRVHIDASTWIFEIPDSERAGRFTEALIAPDVRATSFAGLSRVALELPQSAGTLTVGAPPSFAFAGDLAIPELLDVEIANASAHAWPGLDVQTEGLVRLRYAFLTADGAEVLTGTAALAADLPPHARVELRVPVTPPTRAGTFRLRVDLVQRLGDEEHTLPIPAVELRVEVQERALLSPANIP